jgi:hypothetical protein
MSVLGLFGWAVQDRASPEEPKPATATPPDGAPASQKAVVLLTDGRIITGTVSEEESGYVITQPVGAMRFPKNRVEKTFGSIREVYQYKLEQLPERDFDERMKLARWCLSQKMTAEAKEQLNAIIQLSPKHSQAKAMLISLDQTEARMARQQRDPEVRQTKGEVPSDRPNILDSAVISGAKRNLGISDLPVIFDLPPAQAAKRADEFARYVHPVLQTYCAKCHNERHEGSFQLVEIKTRNDRTRETLRANLDATLRLIDPENSSKSELLSSSLRPHGRGPNTRPIFQGSNDRAYQILATWIHNLKGFGHCPVACGSRGSGTTTRSRERLLRRDPGFATLPLRAGTGPGP